MSLTVALAGDTMLGRGVAPYLARPGHRLLAGDLQEIARKRGLLVFHSPDEVPGVTPPAS